jgi:TM2 domain-containing membrane protein YozV
MKKNRIVQISMILSLFSTGFAHQYLGGGYPMFLRALLAGIFAAVLFLFICGLLTVTLGKRE